MAFTRSNHRQNVQAFMNSIKVSLITAAWASSSAPCSHTRPRPPRRPKWLRTARHRLQRCGRQHGRRPPGVRCSSRCSVARAGHEDPRRQRLEPLRLGLQPRTTSAGIMMVYIVLPDPADGAGHAAGDRRTEAVVARGVAPTSAAPRSPTGAGSGCRCWRPSLMGGFLLFFANAFSAFATAYALNRQSNLVPIKISFFLQGDVTGRSPLPFALATWMIIFMAIVSMGGVPASLRKRAERWQKMIAIASPGWSGLAIGPTLVLARRAVFFIAPLLTIARSRSRRSRPSCSTAIRVPEVVVRGPAPGVQRTPVLADAVAEPAAGARHGAASRWRCWSRLRCWSTCRLPKARPLVEFLTCCRTWCRRSRSWPVSQHSIRPNARWFLNTRLSPGAVLRGARDAVHLPRHRCGHQGDRRAHAGRCLAQPRRGWGTTLCG